MLSIYGELLLALMLNFNNNSYITTLSHIISQSSLLMNHSNLLNLLNLLLILFFSRIIAIHIKKNLYSCMNKEYNTN